MARRRECSIQQNRNSEAFPERSRDESAEKIYYDALSEFYEQAYRFILVGKTGCGKSATGNTILGRKEFEANLTADSLTKVCKIGFGEFHEKQLVVVDSPGICDTKRSHEDIMTELHQVIAMTAPGAHAFLLVLSINQRFTVEEREVVGKLKNLFGPHMVNCLIVIFTHADELEHRGITLENYVGSCEPLRQLLQECQNRYLTVNNRYAPGKWPSRNQFMAKLNDIVIAMLAEANYTCYTNGDFQDCDRYLTEVEEKADKERIIADIKLEDETIKRRYKEKLASIDKKLQPRVPQKKPQYLDSKHQGTNSDPSVRVSERNPTPADSHCQPHNQASSKTVNQSTPPPLRPKGGQVGERIKSLQLQLHDLNIGAIGVRHEQPKRPSASGHSLSCSVQEVHNPTIVREDLDPVEDQSLFRYDDGSTGIQTSPRHDEEARRLAELEYERDRAEPRGLLALKLNELEIPIGREQKTQV